MSCVSSISSIPVVLSVSSSTCPRADAVEDMCDVTPAEVLPPGPVVEGAMSGTGSVLCPAGAGEQNSQDIRTKHDVNLAI